MTIPKAIEIIKQRIAKPRMEWNAQDFRALNLSIEALKVIEVCRETNLRQATYLLPGETEE